MYLYIYIMRILYYIIFMFAAGKPRGTGPRRLAVMIIILYIIII